MWIARIAAFILFCLGMGSLSYAVRAIVDAFGPAGSLPLLACILIVAFLFERHDGYPALLRGRQLLARLWHQSTLK